MTYSSHIVASTFESMTKHIKTMIYLSISQKSKLTFNSIFNYSIILVFFDQGGRISPVVRRNNYILEPNLNTYQINL